MVPVPYTVRRIRRDTYDTFTLDLAPVNGGAILEFRAGQFNMLYIFGVGEVPISISGDPTRPATLLHTTRAVGTVTSRMKELKVGDVLGVRGPFGSYWPIEDLAAQDVVIVAGGIGLAPLRPAIFQILAQRERYGRLTLLYGARTPRDLLYRHELRKWRGTFHMDVHVTVDRGDSNWLGDIGVVTHLIRRAPFDRLNAAALVCGPEIMMRFTAPELFKRGIGPDRIWLSMERNMKCGIGLCGHCQYGPHFVCKDGPVFRYEEIESLLGKREI